MAGDDGRIVERVDEGEALGIPDPLHLGEGLADVRAVQDDPRAIAQAGLHLRADRAGRHHDRDRHARRAAGPGVGLAGVAGRQRDDAAAGRLGRQGRDPVGHPARLERAGLLEVLGLEVEPAVGQRHAGRRGRPGRRRRRDSSGVRWTSPSIRARGGLELGERDDVVVGLGHARRVCHRATARRPARDRTCVFAQMVILFGACWITCQSPPSPTASATPSIGRALADPKRLCVLESLAIGELSVTTSANGSAARSPT